MSKLKDKKKNNLDVEMATFILTLDKKNEQ